MLRRLVVRFNGVRGSGSRFTRRANVLLFWRPMTA